MNLYLNNLSKIMIVLSLLMALSMKSFISIWILMEINLISFLLWQFTIKDQLSMIKYFLIQSFFSILMLWNYLMILNLENSSLNIILLIFLLFSKLGTPPIYLWFINFCASSNFKNLFLAATIQKIIPLALIFNFQFSIPYLWLSFNTLISILGIHRTIYIKPLLGFSSMFNMTWLFLTMNNFNLMMIFLFIYSITLALFIFLILINPKTTLFSDIFMNQTNKNLLMIKFITLISMMGIPPFIGFFGKILMIENFFHYSKEGVLILILILTANMYMIFMYLRIIFLATTLSHNSFILTNNLKSSKLPILLLINTLPLVLFW